MGKKYPLALPKKNCQGGCRRHKLHIPRLVAADCISLEDASGAFELIPSQLLFPVQTLRWFAPGALSLRAPAHSFRCSSSSHRKRCAYFAAGALYFPPDDPLETTKGRACGPFLWISSRGGTGGGRLRGNYGGRRGRFAARRDGGRFFGGRSDSRGRALSRPGAGGLRGAGFRAGASLRTGHGIGNPATNGAKFCYALCFSFRTTHFAGAGGVRGGDKGTGLRIPTSLRSSE